MTTINLFTNILFLLALHVRIVVSIVPVAKKIWSENCDRHGLALNDCNWCRCTSHLQYRCTARVCSQVDMFGHFKDTIQEFDVGMEGHGAWRSSDTACESGVHYKKGELLCVCTEDGKWPNPVCRDVFQVLHVVEPTKYTAASKQNCSPTKLYQVLCNVCYCPSSGKLDPNLCTKKNCSDDVKEAYQEDNHTVTNDVFDQIYAECQRAKKYQLGCKTCICLPNNRLLCDNCTSVSNFTVKMQVKTPNENQNLCCGKTPGKIFKKDCNLCYCDKKDIIYCTVMKCLGNSANVSLPNTTFETVEPPVDDNDCVPGTTYKRDCNTKCYCFMVDGVKYFGCNLKNCDNNETVTKTAVNGTSNEPCGCIEGETYEKNCLICQCVQEKGKKMELCTFNEKCKIEAKLLSNDMRPRTLDSLHGYCEPLHLYDQDCNKCRCLTDGKTAACTSKKCFKLSPQKPMVVEFIPFIQKKNVCPKGHKYKVDCNYCHCMSNDNALCTTNQCKNNVLKLID